MPQTKSDTTEKTSVKPISELINPIDLVRANRLLKENKTNDQMVFREHCFYRT